MNRYVMIAIGGALGSIARYQVAALVQARVPAGFPYGTFVVNMSASFIMGLSMTVITERLNLDPSWRFFVPIGFIGAYSTFSTLEYETFRAASEGASYVAVANVVVSFLVGYVFLWLGVMAGRRLL